MDKLCYSVTSNEVTSHHGERNQDLLWSARVPGTWSRNFSPPLKLYLGFAWKRKFYSDQVNCCKERFLLSHKFQNSCFNCTTQKSYLIQNSHCSGKMSIKSFTKWHVMFWLCIKQYSTLLKIDLFSENGRWLFKSIGTHMPVWITWKNRVQRKRGSHLTSGKSDSFRIFHVAGCVSEAKRSVK